MDNNKIEKPKKKVFGQIIKKLIFLAIIAVCGYWIYKNGGLPKEGIDLGKAIGWETPEEYKQYIPEDVSQFGTFQTMKEISEVSGLTDRSGTVGALIYHKDSKDTEHTNSLCNRQSFTKYTGISDFSNIVGIGLEGSIWLENIEEGAFLYLLIEFTEGTDVKVIAKELQNNMDPSTWTWYEYYKNMSPEDLSIVYNKNYILVTMVEQNLIDQNVAVSKTKMNEAFFEVTGE